MKYHRRTDERQTFQKYSPEPHKTYQLLLAIELLNRSHLNTRSNFSLRQTQILRDHKRKVQNELAQQKQQTIVQILEVPLPQNVVKQRADALGTFTQVQRWIIAI